MRNFKKLLPTALFMSLSVLGVNAMADISANINSKHLNVLFLQTAEKGQLIPDSKQPGMYKLVLKNIDSDISYFTDRPNRVTGLMGADEFVTILKQNNPTNSATQGFNAEIYGIKHHEFHKQAESVVLTLSNPILNTKDDTMTFTAIALQGETLPKQTIKLSHVKLFFDNMDFCPGCNPP